MPTLESTGKPVSPFTPAQLAERSLHRRAVEAVIWGMPAVNARLMIDAVKKSGGDFNQRKNARENIGRIVKLATMSLCLSIPLSSIAFAQTAKDLVGTWTSVSNINIGQNGARVDVFGPHGRGIAIFESNGRFAIVNIDPDVPKFESNRRSHGTAEENKAAVLGGIALFGTYWVSNKTIFFTVEGSTYPNWTGTEQVRAVMSFTGDELKWSLASSLGGTTEVIWKRIK